MWEGECVGTQQGASCACLLTMWARSVLPPMGGSVFIKPYQAVRSRVWAFIINTDSVCVCVFWVKSSSSLLSMLIYPPSLHFCLCSTLLNLSLLGYHYLLHLHTHTHTLLSHQCTSVIRPALFSIPPSNVPFQTSHRPQKHTKIWAHTLLASCGEEVVQRLLTVTCWPFFCWGINRREINAQAATSITGAHQNVWNNTNAFFCLLEQFRVQVFAQTHTRWGLMSEWPLVVKLTTAVSTKNR